MGTLILPYQHRQKTGKTIVGTDIYYYKLNRSGDKSP